MCVCLVRERERNPAKRHAGKREVPARRRDAARRRYEAPQDARWRSGGRVVEVGGEAVKVGGCAVEVGGGDKTILTIVPRGGSWSMVGMAGTDATILTILTIVPRGGSWSMVGMAGADATIPTILTIVSRRRSWSMVGGALKVTEV